MIHPPPPPGLRDCHHQVCSTNKEQQRRHHLHTFVMQCTDSVADLYTRIYWHCMAVPNTWCWDMGVVWTKGGLGPSKDMPILHIFL